MSGPRRSPRLLPPPEPSRPGELHPEPLTGPDVSLSTYPARTTFEGCRLPPRPAGSSCCQLTLICLHAGRPLHWDRIRARPALGGGFPISLFRLRVGFTVPPMATFPEAPL